MAPVVALYGPDAPAETVRLVAAAASAAFGAVVGSFLTVVVDRVPRGRSVVAPPSHCGGCGRRLRVAELVPILSYLAARGRCRTCGAPIGGLTLAVEVAGALAFGLIGGLFLWSALTVWAWCMAALVVALAAVDLERRLLPNRILLVGLALAALLEVALRPVPPLAALVGGAGMAVVGVAFALAGMGMGDAKLLALLGVFLGLEAALLAFVTASALGALFGLGRILVRGGSLKETLPFGPPLAVGAVAALVLWPAVAQALHLAVGGTWA
jgi:leader peptidase (prepilin peptidase)/N-methyltransferase